ncbi:hypothetical protein [Stenotrophomonas sp. GZD-301]|uniref:hypothetical protein n=1 Tax=Stenotrophomonas sp. GZD-301 TaxID=3404814 RepID=UPI003BB61ABA
MRVAPVSVGDALEDLDFVVDALSGVLPGLWSFHTHDRKLQLIDWGADSSMTNR